MRQIHLRVPLSETSDEMPTEFQSLAIGYFDGVHRGHAEVIGRAVTYARAHGIQSAVMTFHPHPKEVLGRGSQYATFLTPLEAKLQAFAELGVDLVYIVQFDLPFAAVTPQQFVDQLLVPLGIRRVVVGFDFHFGARGAGDVTMLHQLCEPADITVEDVPPLLDGGNKVSSSRIRQLLADGEPAAATRLLGRRFAVRGVVVRGEGRGKTIGFATANVEPHHRYAQPRLGVYAVRVVLNPACSDAQAYAGVLNVGRKPTFHDEDDAPVVYEAHLFDFAADLYGREVEIEFVDYIRDERKFASVDELIRQIRLDATRAREVLATNG